MKIAELDNHHEGGGVAFTGLHGDNVSMAMRPKVTPCASFFFFFLNIQTVAQIPSPDIPNPVKHY